jgi:hypothetical protein
VLGSDRFGRRRASANHPRVLAAMRGHRSRGAAARKTLEVCGEAASEPTRSVLVGSGGELSVGAARGRRRARLDPRAPLRRATAGRDAAAERVERDGRVVAVGPEA